MKKSDLLEKSESMIEDINWLPDWGKSRISAMLTDRPDWCVSRQRTWGVPLPLVIHKETGELHKDTLEIIDRIAKKVATEGDEAWFSEDIKNVLDKETYDKVIISIGLDPLDVAIEKSNKK